MNTIVLDPTQDPGQDIALRRIHEHKALAAPAAFRFEADADGIGWLTFDMPGSSVNVFNESTLRELDDHLEAIESDPTLKALVIRSAKEKVFVAGADLKAIRALPPAKLEAFIQLGQSVFNRLASLPLPKIAAIHGACVGGGMELVLACDYRIASDADCTRLGLPEVQLGLIPGWGGTTRLPRMLGLPKALDLILSGRLLKPELARKVGIADRVVPREHLEAAVRKLLRVGGARANENLPPHPNPLPVGEGDDGAAAPRGNGDYNVVYGDNSARSDSKTAISNPASRSVSSGSSFNSLSNGERAGVRGPSFVRPSTSTSFHLSNLPVIRRIICCKARRDLMEKTRGLYAAPLMALKVATRGLGMSIDESLRFEREALLELAKTGEAARLIDLFFRREEASKKLPASGTALPVHHATVVGAGVMGAGIAQWLASRGVHVLMTDVSTDAIAKGLSKVSSLVEEGVKRRAITKKEARESMDRLSVTHAKVPLHHHQLIIEAATENMDVKKKIFADLASCCAPDTILATNTSALSVTELASSVVAPERVIGLHFFNPVHRMPLVEVITHAGNTPDVIATAVAFVQRIGKTPVVVKDSPGFVVNRVLMPYLLEAVRLHESGVPVEEIDLAMLEFGMPMGPLRLLDEIGLDVAAHVGKTMMAAFPDRLPKTDLLDCMVAEGLLGKKSGRGFYDYTTKHRPHFSGEVNTEIQERLAMLLSDEAKRCLDEGVAATASDIDLAMVLGTGYPPFRGGPLEFIRSANGKL